MSSPTGASTPPAEARRRPASVDELRQLIRRMSFRQFLDPVARFIGLPADEELLGITTRQASFDFMRRHVAQFDDHPFQREMERAQGLSPGKPLEKVRTGHIGDRDRELSADTRALLDETWKREIAERLGIRSYEQLRAETSALAVS